MINAMLFSSVVLASVYAIVARIKNKSCLESVSSISYILPSWMFTIFFGLESILIAPSIFESLPEDWKFIGILCLFGLWAVGASPYYRSESTVLHYFGGYFFCIVAQVIVILLFPYLLVLWLPVLYYVVSGIIQKKDRPDRTFWAETTAFVVLVLSLMIG